MSIYDRLNEQQKEGVFTVEGPVLILAGAGSGKTGVLTHRIAHMIEDESINPYNILAITFTNKAAKEMRERVDRLVKIGAEAAWIMTFHAACVRILRRHIDRIGYDSNFTIYDTDDQKSVIKEVLKKLDLDPKKYREKAVLSDISKAKDELLTPDDMYQASGGRFEKIKIAEIYREYQETLKKSNALDFDDIINKTVELFEKEPEILDYYQDRFKYIMVDEYQDTNTAQFNFIKLLASKYKNLCVVGDDDQSIYKFRGANILNILNFEQYFPEAKVIKLEQNYRSTQNILDVANNVIANNSGRKEKRLWTQEGSGDKILFNVYENGFEEAEGIALAIRKYVDDGYSYNDCAILYRTNAQSRALEEKLVQLSIPYRIYGGVNFYSRKEVKDILAYLKTIDNAKDDLAVKRILNVPKRGIGATTIEKVQLYAYQNDMTFYDALCHAEDIPGINRAVEKIKAFVGTIRVFRSKLEFYTVDKLISDVIDTIEYIEYLDATETPESVDERKENLDELISKAVAYEETDDEATLGGFLEDVALVADIDNLDENNDIVSLMTLHSAKGLEFPIVFISGMEDGLFPGYGAVSSEDESELEEERRLCYVGITRAREKLILSAARMRMVRGEININKISRFINEIPQEFMVTSGQNTRRKSPILSEDTFFSKPRTPGESPFKSFQCEAVRKKAFDLPVRTDNSEKKIDYSVGDTVSHQKFGTGTVLEIKDGGRDFEVTVEFENAGKKKMFASFAKLVKI